MSILKKIKKFFEIPEEYTRDYTEEIEQINKFNEKSMKIFRECIDKLNSTTKILLKTDQYLKNNIIMGKENINTSKNIINDLHSIKNTLNSDKKDDNILDVNDFTLI